MLKKTLNSILNFSNKEAFFIDGVSFTYSDFGKKITSIIKEIKINQTKENQIIGIIADNNFDTFASIYAIWFSGCAFVPLSVNIPKERNNIIANQLDLKLIIDTTSNINNYLDSKNINIIDSTKLNSEKTEISLLDYPLDNLSYILFTSGSTGTPKGVQISNKNINAFYNNFISLGYKINETDKFLQSFELTFDLSVKSYIIPLSIGARLCTPKKTGIKHLNIFKSIKENEITFVTSVPSTVSLLKPYFKDILLPNVKYMLFSAEALTFSLANEWQKCIPNAEIINCFGPTETTIVCTEYIWKRNGKNESYNDNLTIGKPFGDNKHIIIDNKNNIVKTEEKGELCISGNQVSEGYYKMPEKNKTTFIKIHGNLYYKTGDIVFQSKTGNIMYVGRADTQVQMQGHRVELGDISFGFKKVLPNADVTIITENILGIPHIIAFIEKYNGNTEKLKEELLTHIPHYMIPSYIFSINEFPYSANGKKDKNKLKEIFKSLINNDK